MNYCRMCRRTPFAVNTEQKLQGCGIIQNDTELVEILASGHGIWAGWARWMIDKFDNRMVEMGTADSCALRRTERKEKDSDRRDWRLFGND